MKRLTWSMAVALLTLTPCAYADSTPTFNITGATILVGSGSDNVSFSLTGPGTSISGYGGLQCQLVWCDGQVFPAGTLVQDQFGFDGQIFIDNFTAARLGGTNYDAQTLSFDFWALNNPSDITLEGRSTFAVCEYAAMSSPVSGFAGSGSSFTSFTLQLASGGKFCSTWDFIPALDGFVFDHGEFTVGAASGAPEPGSLGLLLAGLAGAFGVGRRAKARSRPSADRLKRFQNKRR
jgi:hypothetical protein